jgi:putative membrane protein
MANERNISDKIWLVLKGLAMGTANKVPGVSGGIVAFVAGFYEEFIYSLQKINRKAFLLLFNRGLKSFLEYTNARFLGLLFLGMIISYFSISKVLDYLLANYELYVWSTFFGMIIGSLYYITKDFGEWKRKFILFLLVGIGIGISISFLEPAKENNNLLFVFFCGIIGVSGMTLPGLSGSFILILLGNYVLLLVDSVNALYDTFFDVFQGDFSFIDNQNRIHLLKVLVVFSLGSIVGLVSLSNVLAYLLKHYKKTTNAVIIGFIAGSLGVVWPWKTKVLEKDALGTIIYDTHGREIITSYQRYFPSEFTPEVMFAIIFIIVGILILLFLDGYHKIKLTSNG